MIDPDLFTNEHHTIAAPTGGGKSFLAGAMVEGFYAEKKPFIVLDTKNLNHAGLLKLKRAQLLKIEPRTRYDFARALSIAPYLIVIPSRQMRTAPLIEQYRELLTVLYDSHAPRTVFIEEAHLYNPNGNTPDQTLELLAREGRGAGQQLIFIDQRLQQFPKLLWSQCKFTWFTKWMIPHDIRYLDTLIPNFSAVNRDLKDHDVIKFDHKKSTFKLYPAGQIKRITPHLG